MASSSDTIPHVSATEAFDALRSDGDARLVDVRTRAEWSFVGLPIVSGADAEPVLIEWQSFPQMTVDQAFGEALESAFPDKSTGLYFLCRSGARSLAAAQVMQARGYTNVFNVKDGFEGPPDGDGHRGNVAGWKAEGLPWRQN